MSTRFTRWAILLSVLLIGFIVWILYHANQGTLGFLTQWLKDIPYYDKIAHFSLFGLLTLLLNFALQTRHFLICGLPLYWGAIATTSFAAIEELSQAFIPHRTLDIWDFTADIVGIVLACVLTKALLHYQNRQALSKSQA